MCLIQNEIGDEAAVAISDHYFGSESASDLKKLIIKNPITRFKKLTMDYILSGMLRKVQNLSSLKYLQLT